MAFRPDPNEFPGAPVPAPSQKEFERQQKAAEAAAEAAKGADFEGRMALMREQAKKVRKQMEEIERREQTIRQLPPIRPPGFYKNWPPIDPPPTRPLPPAGPLNQQAPRPRPF
jgi:hypothetical protein